MASLERRAVEDSLKKKGFDEERHRDHRHFKLMVDGKYTGISTKVSHGSGYKTLSSALVSQLAKQVCLTNGEFQKLIACPLRKGDYLALLEERGEI